MLDAMLWAYRNCCKKYSELPGMSRKQKPIASCKTVCKQNNVPLVSRQKY
jgi:hypothetical protein